MRHRWRRGLRAASDAGELPSERAAIQIAPAAIAAARPTSARRTPPAACANRPMSGARGRPPNAAGKPALLTIAEGLRRAVTRCDPDRRSSYDPPGPARGPGPQPKRHAGRGRHAATRVVDIDAAAFADAFARRSVAIRHHLVDHPLFTHRRDRGAGRPSAAGIRPARARRPPARELRRLRRGRAGAAIADDQGRRAKRRQDLAARHPAGAGVRRADQRVPGRGRRARRRPRGRHDASGRVPVHLLPRPRRRRCTSTSSTASCFRSRAPST